MQATSQITELTDREIRETLPRVKPTYRRLTLTTLYLTACRASELKSFSAENVIQKEWKNRPILVLKIRTLKSKEEDAYRSIAIPLEKQYEPLSQSLLDFARSRRDPSRPLFPWVRQTIYNHVVEYFKQFHYRIERQGNVKAHWKTAAPHAFRHARLSNLVNDFDFDSYDVAAYTGWELKTVDPLMPPVMKRYVRLQYTRYIDKLFREKQE